MLDRLYLWLGTSKFGKFARIILPTSTILTFLIAVTAVANAAIGNPVHLIGLPLAVFAILTCILKLSEWYMMRSHDELAEFISTTILPPGELTDRLTILRIKEEKLGISTIEEVLALVKLIDAHSTFLSNEMFAKYTNLSIELFTINAVQWDLEDRVRTEESWEAARAARDNNTKRVAIKNKINALFGWGPEIKKYKGE